MRRFIFVSLTLVFLIMLLGCSQNDTNNVPEYIVVEKQPGYYIFEVDGDKYSNVKEVRKYRNGDLFIDLIFGSDITYHTYTYYRWVLS